MGAKRSVLWAAFVCSLLIFILISQSLAEDCRDCELKNASLINVAFTNATDSSGRQATSHFAILPINASYCGCPALINLAILNATDAKGRQIGPEIVYERINITYYAALDIIKIPHLITNMSEVGPDLLLVGYNITVINIGQVNITGIEIFDPGLGNFTIGKLRPGQNMTVSPNPIYIVTPDDIKYCYINNTVYVIGKDRCCKPIGPFFAYSSFPLGTKNLEKYLKEYSYQLLEYSEDLKKNKNASQLEDLEQKIRVQANRLMIFGKILEKGNVSSCQLPPKTSFNEVEANPNCTSSKSFPSNVKVCSSCRTN